MFKPDSQYNGAAFIKLQQRTEDNVINTTVPKSKPVEIAAEYFIVIEFKMTFNRQVVL